MSFDRNAYVKLDDGAIVERDVLGIVEKITEYDENLRVQYLDPSSGADFSDAPYRIVEVCPDGKVREVFSVWALDEKVLERIYAADTQRIDVLTALNNHNALLRKERERRYEEKKLEAQDIVSHVLKSPKGRYTIPKANGEGVAVIDDSLKRLPPEEPSARC